MVSLFVAFAVPDRKKIPPQILRKSIPKLFLVPVYREKKVLMKNKHFLFSFMKRMCKILSQKVDEKFVSFFDAHCKFSEKKAREK